MTRSFVQDAGAIIIRIKIVSDLSQYRFDSNLLNKYKLKYLIKLHNQETRRVMNNVVNQIEDNSIIKHEIHAVIVNSRIMEKSLRKSIRVIDTKNTKISYIISKYPDHYNLIDIKVRNMFKKGLLSSTLKYYCSFNICRIRNNMINTKKTNASYPRYR